MYGGPPSPMTGLGGVPRNRQKNSLTKAPRTTALHGYAFKKFRTVSAFVSTRQSQCDLPYTLTDIPRFRRWRRTHPIFAVHLTEVARSTASRTTNPLGSPPLRMDSASCIKWDAFCLLTLDGTEEACYSASEATGLGERASTPDHDSVTWSPDGRFVAFTTNPWVYAEDSDIWLFAVNTGQFTNLTDDGYEGRIFGTTEDIGRCVIDYAPAWKPPALTLARQQCKRMRLPSALWSLRSETANREGEICIQRGKWHVSRTGRRRRRRYTLYHGAISAPVAIHGHGGPEMRSSEPAARGMVLTPLHA